MRDGSIHRLTVSHHKGCHGVSPCHCEPIKTSDRITPRRSLADSAFRVFA